MTFFEGKNVFITGHTGFKGAWLAFWLHKLGANVTGYALPPYYEDSLFHLLDLPSKIRHIEGDIADLDHLKSSISESCPNQIYHLAAQAIVSKSYEAPIETIATNVLGTAHLLESIRSLSQPTQTILVTSDKSYNNLEWPWGYRETDELGGKDIYSGSKGAAELVIKSYISSFFHNSYPHSIGIARAGNVIGGGDWSSDRLIPDLYRSWSVGRPVEIRCPEATRPWQHVLEPLSGYIKLAHQLSVDSTLHGESFNFGPCFQENKTVIDVIKDLFQLWPSQSIVQPYSVVDHKPFNEASLLKLNCDKALQMLKWKASLSYHETIEYVSEWYAAYSSDPQSCASVTDTQIENYTKISNLEFLLDA